MFSRKSILKLSQEFLALAQVYNLVSYHGTDAKYLYSIANRGLLALVPPGPNQDLKGVYLTSNIETAALYATTPGYQKPVILEVNLSSPKRLKKLRHDPLDRAESYNDYQEYFWQDDLRQLESICEEIIPNFNSRFLERSDASDFQGINLYEEILSQAREQDLDITMIKSLLKEKLPAGFETEYFMITPSGTLQLTEAAYNSMHQMIYPKKIPAVAIKAVWIPESLLKTVPSGMESKKFGIALLPQHIQEYNNGIMRAPQLIDNIEELIEYYEDINDSGRGLFNEVIAELKSAASDPDYEFDPINFEFDPLYPGDEIKRQNWVKIPVTREELPNVASWYKD